MGVFGSGLNRFWKKVLVCVILLFYLICSVVVNQYGTVVSYSEFFADSSNAQGVSNTSQIFVDAGTHRQFLENEELLLTEYNSIYMDNKTVERILRAVENYNNEVAASVEIEYEYKKYYGECEVDEITGEIISTALSSTNNSDGQTLSEKISLCRVNIDNDSKHFGEDIFYLQWQPVFVMCAMYIQNNIELIGSYNEESEDGNSYYLTENDIANIIDIFTFHYIFYDDYTVRKKASVKYDDILKESSGYRLDISKAEDGSLTVKRIPALAPKKIYNSYLSYEYMYKELNNGYYELTSRVCRFNPQGFISACEALIPDFDTELFIEELRLLPDSEDIAVYYANLVDKGADSYETYSVEECPVIKTRVSTVTGFFAKLFKRNEAGENIAGGMVEVAEKNQNSAVILSNEQFLSMIDVAETCLGTPYKMGGYTPGVSMDCSGFVSYVLRQCGWQFNNDSAHGPDTIALYNYCTSIPANEAVAGDIIFFHGTYRKGISHVGIYVGNNRMIHCGSPCQYARTDTTYWKQHFYGFGRLPEK